MSSGASMLSCFSFRPDLSLHTPPWLRNTQIYLSIESSITASLVLGICIVFYKVGIHAANTIHAAQENPPNILLNSQHMFCRRTIKILKRCRDVIDRVHNRESSEDVSHIGWKSMSNACDRGAGHCHAYLDLPTPFFASLLTPYPAACLLTTQHCTIRTLFTIRSLTVLAPRAPVRSASAKSIGSRGQVQPKRKSKRAGLQPKSASLLLFIPTWIDPACRGKERTRES